MVGFETGQGDGVAAFLEETCIARSRCLVPFRAVKADYRLWPDPVEQRLRRPMEQERTDRIRLRGDMFLPREAELFAKSGFCETRQCEKSLTEKNPDPRRSLPAIARSPCSSSAAIAGNHALKQRSDSAHSALKQRSDSAKKRSGTTMGRCQRNPLTPKRQVGAVYPNPTAEPVGSGRDSSLGLLIASGIFNRLVPGSPATRGFRLPRRLLQAHLRSLLPFPRALRAFRSPRR